MIHDRFNKNNTIVKFSGDLFDCLGHWGHIVMLVKFSYFLEGKFLKIQYLKQIFFCGFHNVIPLMGALNLTAPA